MKLLKVLEIEGKAQLSSQETNNAFNSFLSSPAGFPLHFYIFPVVAYAFNFIPYLSFYYVIIMLYKFQITILMTYAITWIYHKLKIVSF